MQEISLHEKKINTVHLEPGAENLLVTGIGNGTVALWDARKLAKGASPVASGGHSFSCQAAYFAPDGESLPKRARSLNLFSGWVLKAHLHSSAFLLVCHAMMNMIQPCIV